MLSELPLVLIIEEQGIDVNLHAPPYPSPLDTRYTILYNTSIDRT